MGTILKTGILAITLLLTFTLGGAVVWAQAQEQPRSQYRSQSLIKQDPRSTITLHPKKTESPLMPILPTELLGSTPKNLVTNEVADQLYNRCLSKVPPRFTPDAHQYYCTCTSAAASAVMKMSEITEMQSSTNWKIDNPTFVKYISEVVSPCLDTPTEDMEYMSCILYRGNDWRIDRVSDYCKCVSHAMKNHVRDYGTSEMLIAWGTPGKNYDSPLDALWNDDTYNQYKNKFRQQCIGSYLKSDPYNR